VGHWARYCPNKAKKKEQAHTAQVEEEEEPTLLMAQASQVNTSSSSAPLAPTPPAADPLAPTPPPAHRRVEIEEQKVFAELGPREDRDPLRWVLDSGATNHMTGARSAFAELDTNIHGTVRFGDGSVVEIEGRGSVVFTCKGGEHRALTGVYYIPRLTADIISLGQLEEAGCRIVMDVGVLRIYEPGRKLLARVKRSSSRLYLLELKVDRTVCLSTRGTEKAWWWHARFGHISFQSLRRLVNHDMVHGLPSLQQVEQLCDAYLAGKHRRAPSLSKRDVEQAASSILSTGISAGLSPP
jgi:hypothetical protein